MSRVMAPLSGAKKGNEHHENQYVFDIGVLSTA
ncbi:hypothetical protein ACVI1K_007720 [Bradyrhizobium sp. USDA 4508]|nr:hypothetical protein [Bradyrhizobium sp. USDA 4541]